MTAHYADFVVMTAQYADFVVMTAHYADFVVMTARYADFVVMTAHSADFVGTSITIRWDKNIKSNSTYNILAVQSFDVQRTWRRVFHKRIVSIKFDIHVFIIQFICIY